MSNLLWRTFVRGLHKVAGLDSPYSQQEYGKNWSKQQKRCRERDGHECRVCGTARKEIGRSLSVHHITPRSQFGDGEWRQYNDLDNLVSLCPSCHGAFEGRFIEEDVDGFVTRAREANA